MGSHIKNKAVKGTLADCSLSSRTIMEGAVDGEQVQQRALSRRGLPREDKDARPWLRVPEPVRIDMTGARYDQSLSSISRGRCSQGEPLGEIDRRQTCFQILQIAI